MTTNTVQGPVDKADLGHIQPHEHVLIDLTTPAKRSSSGAGEPADVITLENYYDIRRHHNDSREFVSREDAIEEIKHFAAAGGGTIVDLTSGGIGRDPEGLAAVSKATGVHIVMGCGYYVDEYHPNGLADRNATEITDEIVTEFSEGVGESRIRPGIIGEIGMTWPPTDAETMVLRAAATAQKVTGLSLNIHPGRDQQAPLDHVRTAVHHGADAQRIVVSHLDRTLFTIDALLRLAAEGVYLEFDLFGKEASFYHLADIDMPNDARRVQLLLELAEAGHLDQLLISQDICHRTNIKKYGGEGYDHILTRVIPLMLRRGFTEQDIQHITQTNPARILSLQS